MTEAELLPCPFCGDIGRIKHWRDDNAWSVGCHNLDCYAVIDENRWYEVKEAAVAAWNTRAPSPEQRERKER